MRHKTIGPPASCATWSTALGRPRPQSDARRDACRACPACPACAACSLTHACAALQRCMVMRARERDPTLARHALLQRCITGSAARGAPRDDARTQYACSRPLMCKPQNAALLCEAGARASLRASGTAGAPWRRHSFLQRGTKQQRGAYKTRSSSVRARDFGAGDACLGGAAQSRSRCQLLAHLPGTKEIQHMPQTDAWLRRAAHLCHDALAEVRHVALRERKVRLPRLPRAVQ
jgi:hypothetical protein